MRLFFFFLFCTFLLPLHFLWRCCSSTLTWKIRKEKKTNYIKNRERRKKVNEWGKKKSKKCRKRLSEVANRREGKGEDNRSEVLHTAWGGLWESTRCSWLTQALQTSLLFPFVRALRRFLCFSSFFVLFCFLPCTLLRSGLKSDQKKCLSRGFTSGGIVHPLVLRQSRNNNKKKRESDCSRVCM